MNVCKRFGLIVIGLSLLILFGLSCETKPGKNQDQASLEGEINQFLDTWHAEATKADTLFFHRLSSDGIYIGTDPNEHWNLDEFRQFAMPFFLKKQGWDFKPLERHLYFSEDQSLVWFDEKLDTWMGICRSSGVVRNEKGEWKIAHYHLSISVPNALVRPYLNLLETHEKEAKPNGRAQP